jgi:hypothetical protein
MVPSKVQHSGFTLFPLWSQPVSYGIQDSKTHKKILHSFNKKYLFKYFTQKPKTVQIWFACGDPCVQVPNCDKQSILMDYQM